MGKKFDFSGWATRANVKCSDGRTIMKDAFKDCDGAIVPLVWNHQHNDPANVLGHALLQCKNGDVYAYCTFNDSESAGMAKELVKHGDIRSLSILANQLQQRGSDVVHGIIREVSLVLAGANPKAFIENVVVHGENSEDTAMMYFDDPISIEHGEILDEQPEEQKEEQKEETISHADKEDSNMAEQEAKSKEKTVGDVFDTLSEEQKQAVYAIIGQVLEDAEGSEDNDEEENAEMKHNLFDQEDRKENDVLSHDAMSAIIGDAKRYGSMKESFLQHADDYGIQQIDYLFPDAKTLNTTPEFIQRDMGWVQKVIG